MRAGVRRRRGVARSGKHVRPRPRPRPRAREVDLFVPKVGANRDMVVACSIEKDPPTSPMTGPALPPPSLVPGTPNSASPREYHRGAASIKGARSDSLAPESPSVAYQPYRQASPKVPVPTVPGAWVSRGGPNNTMAPPSPSPAGTPYSDLTETPLQLSPLSRPANGRSGGTEYADISYFDDDRRPSVASVATASSQGSQSSTSRAFHKKLTGFFGDEYRDRTTVESQESNALGVAGPGRSSTESHQRNNSVATNSTGDGRTASPSSRPRTPMPSSEVAPWVYQDTEVSIRPVTLPLAYFSRLARDEG